MALRGLWCGMFIYFGLCAVNVSMFERVFLQTTHVNLFIKFSLAVTCGGEREDEWIGIIFVPMMNLWDYNQNGQYEWSFIEKCV